MPPCNEVRSMSYSILRWSRRRRSWMVRSSSCFRLSSSALACSHTLMESSEVCQPGGGGSWPKCWWAGGCCCWRLCVVEGGGGAWAIEDAGGGGGWEAGAEESGWPELMAAGGGRPR